MPQSPSRSQVMQSSLCSESSTSASILRVSSSCCVESRDLHPRVDLDQAGGDHAGPPFYLDHAQPAVAGRGDLFIKAQAGDVKAVVPGHLQQVVALGRLDLLAVDGQSNGFRHDFLRDKPIIGFFAAKVKHHR